MNLLKKKKKLEYRISVEIKVKYLKVDGKKWTKKYGKKNKRNLELTYIKIDLDSTNKTIFSHGYILGGFWAVNFNSVSKP